MATVHFLSMNGRSGDIVCLREDILKLNPFQPGAIVVANMVTKRQLGLLFILLGVGAAVAMFAIDLLGAGQFQGIGPAQRRALLAASLAVIIGLTLLPLGNRPA